MRPNVKYTEELPEFWAFVRYTSEYLGYSKRAAKGQARLLREFNIEEVEVLPLASGIAPLLREHVVEYLNYRAHILNDHVEKQLMDRKKAERVFRELRRRYQPKCALPLNKQKGAKRHFAFFTCIVNILTEASLGGKPFIDTPDQLATVCDKSGKLVMTLSRRIDGAYPTLADPVAIWEVKEYYGTTTFGSRVADGVYETQLDGYEIREAGRFASHKIEHYLLVDDHYTWWQCGRSYLCRLVDAMHMGLVDEVIFGSEIVERWPDIVSRWPRH
jgi:hypothetical protein